MKPLTTSETHLALQTLAFRKTWRPYQQRVLDAFLLHLADRKLHVVAAPGSGKTTLGLEIMRRLGQPAIILSPTRTVRDQWIERLRDFLPAEEPWPVPWVGRTLETPGVVTSITYQALHAKARSESEDASPADKEDEEAETGGSPPIDHGEIEWVAERLNSAGVGTVILDEAHHLRAEWWKALTRLLERLGDVSVVSLTATPPYDAIGEEWARYEELCGVIDEEISVPELVQAGTLVPHQDFVWTVVAGERESEFASRHVDAVTSLIGELVADDLFRDFVASHPWISAPTPDPDAVYGNPAVAMALLAFQKSQSMSLPAPLLGLLDLQPADVPALTLARWETLLEYYLLTADQPADEGRFAGHRRALARRMRESHLLDHRHVQLRESRLVKRQLTQSPAKLAACVEIHRHERAVRGDRLRQVILADYIRDDEMGEDGSEPRSLGAWPVFRAVVGSVEPIGHPVYALLTGRLILVHERLLPHLAGVDARDEAVDRLPGFRRLTGVTGDVVAALTRCLDEGLIQCLVGTRALLGEGWDAPCVNSLVIASNVGAYMLTNQMRGRALRVHADDPDKVASIWHIVAIAFNRKPMDVLFPPTIFFPGVADLLELETRFRTFVGIDSASPVIENSLSRLNLPCFTRRHDGVTGGEHLRLRPDAFRHAASVARWNETMIERLRHLPEVRKGWLAAIGAGQSGRVVPLAKTANPPTVAPFHLRLTLRYFLFVAFATFGAVASLAFRVPKAALPIFAIAAVCALPAFVRAAVLWLRHLPVDGTIHQIGLAVRDTLCALRLIDEPATRVPVESMSQDGEAYVNISGGSVRDRALFADCMREILSPVDNPRFLLVREGTSLGRASKDYHAVPTCLGVKKESAELLLAAWRKRVGPAELVYTRSADNRRILGRARSRAFSNAAARSAARMERWL